jgi:hypothetical protein
MFLRRFMSVASASEIEADVQVGENGSLQLQSSFSSTASQVRENRNETEDLGQKYWRNGASAFYVRGAPLKLTMNCLRFPGKSRRY